MISEGFSRRRAAGTSQLQLVGGFRLIVDDVTVQVQPSGQRLLALTSLRGPCARTLAAGTLWGDSSQAKALACLRTTIWRLGKLGLIVSETTSDVVRNPPGLPVDVLDLPALIASWRDGARSAKHLHALTRELLPGWYEDWVILERERVRQLLMLSVERNAEQAIQDGDPRDGLEWGLLAVDLDPLRESAHRLVVRAHIAAGNVAEARRHYEAVRALLASELGVAPSPYLRDLARVTEP